jgi:hypothetical protein
MLTETAGHSLQDLKSRLDQYTLADIMGEDPFALLRLLFPRQNDFQITQIADVSGDDTHLDFTATFTSLLPWPQPVLAHFSLFDVQATRHVLFYFQVPVPAPYSAYVYLSQYSQGPAEPLAAPGALAPFTPVARLAQEIVFAADAAQNAIPFLFSTLDYSAPEAGGAFYPDAFKSLMPSTVVRAGLNFPLLAALSDDLSGVVTVLLGGAANGKAACRGLVYARDDVLSFRLSHPDIAAGKTVGDFTLSLTQIDTALPLARGTGAWPETILTGQVRIKDTAFGISADFNMYARTLGLAFHDFPTLGDLIALAGAPDLKNYFPTPLDTLLTVSLAELGILLDLSGGKVLDIDLSLTTATLTLVSFSADSRIAIKPILDLRIQAPFSPAERAITGDVTGIWQLGNADFQTTLYFPGYDFYAGLIERPGNKLDVGAIFAQILPAIEMPHIEITELQFTGNLVTHSVTAQLSMDGAGTWDFQLAGKTYGLDGISMQVAFANGQFAAAEIDCHLELANAHFFISGQYDKTRGLSISGGTAEHETIDVGVLANDLMKGLSLPERCPPLKLTNILFTATPKLGQYSLSGQTDGAWVLASGLTLQVEQFSISKSQDGPVGGLLLATLTLDEIKLDLFAAKAGSTDGGWQVAGSASQIPLGKLIAGVSKALSADTTVPGALEGLIIDYLSVAFTSAADTTFTFTCEAKYPADGGKADITLFVEYKRGATVGDKVSYSVNFCGTVNIAGQVFAFELLEVEKGGASSMLLVGTYRSEKPLALMDLLTGLGAVGSADAPPVSVAIKDALFAYARDDIGPRYLFGLTLDANLNLAHLPDVFGAVGTLGVQDLTVLYASGDLSRGQADAINAELVSAKIAPLPLLPPPAQSPKAPSPPGMSQGLSLSAVLNLPGGEHMPIVVPRPKAQTGDTPATSGPGAALAAAGPGLPAAAAGPASASAAASGTWFDVQKSVGPLYVDKIGVRYAESRVWFLLAAALRTGALTLEVDGLGLGFNPSNPADMDFTLAGLSLDFESGSVSITGVFLEGQAPVYGPDGRPVLKDNKPVMITQFAGEVRIGLPVLTIVGVGAYGRLSNGDPTLFLYATLSMADGEGIGYPPVLITGLALGFGINYRVVIPPIEGVSAFPLVTMVMGPGGQTAVPAGPADPGAGGQPGQALAAPTDPGAVLRTLLTGDRPSLEMLAGEYFGALGLRFSLFETIDAFGLAVVQAGVDLEISLLGLGRLKEPQEGDAVCYIELALLVDIRPSEGILRIEAQLTANAWVLDPNCRLTGGFALVVWYGGEHRGDFVISIGGYHPRFLVPAHYPVVPRLGFNLQLGPLVMKGASYFALTPSAIMAGARLEAVFSAGPILASFVAYIDFLVQWKPLHYDIGAGIAIHIAIDLGLFTLDITLGVDLLIQGPPFHGIARIYLGPISFTIGFGVQSNAPTLIAEWSEFTSSFLDRSQPAEAPASRLAAAAPAIHQLHLVAGQITRPVAPGQPSSAGDNTVWFVRADELELAAMSALPASELVLGQVAAGDPTIGDALAAGNAASGVERAISGPLVAAPRAKLTTTSPLGMRPMGVTKLESPCIVTVVDEDNQGRVNNLDQWTMDEDRSAMPAAVWDNVGLDPAAPPNAKTVPDCVVGVRRLRPPTGDTRGEQIGGITAQALAYDPLDDKPVSEKLAAQAAPQQPWDAIPQVNGDEAVRRHIAVGLQQAGFIEAANFGTAAAVSRPLDAVPMRSVLSGTATSKE